MSHMLEAVRVEERDGGSHKRRAPRHPVHIRLPVLWQTFSIQKQSKRAHFKTPQEQRRPTLNNPSPVAEYARALIWEKIEKLGQGSYQCRVCGLQKTSTGLTALKNHIEAKHLGKALSYTCEICHRVLNSANAYHSHMHALHRKPTNNQSTSLPITNQHQ